MTEVATQTKQRDISLDIMRIIAIYFVIFNHSNEKGFWLFAQCEPGFPAFWAYMFISVICKMAVPLFFMISGAVLLSKEDETLKNIWGKRIPRMLVLLVLISLVYYLRRVFLSGGEFHLADFLKETYQTSYWHLWYMYAYIAYLMCLPFLRALVRGLEDKYFRYWIALALFFVGILPVVEYLLWKGGLALNGNMRPSWLFTNIVLYPCIGYYLYKRVDVRMFRVGGGICAMDICDSAPDCLMLYDISTREADW